MKPVVRCSGLDQLFECGASRILMPLVRARKGAEAHEGNQGHWEIAARLVTKHGATEPAGGLFPPDVPHGYEMPKNGRWMVDYCERVANELIPFDWSMEVEAPLAYEFERFILSGHEDLVGISPDGKKARGVDWKLGSSPVDEAEMNNQVLGYIVLLKRAYPFLECVEFYVVQPRNNPNDGFLRISIVKVEGADLDACVSYVERKINDSLDNDMEMNTGRKQCRWCPVSFQCPAIQAEIEQMKLLLTPQMLAEIHKDPRDDVVGDIFIIGRTLTNALKDCTDIVEERLDKNKSLRAGCGTVITQKYEGGSYAVESPAEMYAGVCALLPPEKVAGCISYSIMRIKDSIAETLDIPKGGQAPMTAENVFAAKLAPFVKQGQRRKFIFT